MSFVPTPAQERALALDGHLCVTANAGAGKTTVLARRFVEIFVATDARLPEVAAITFTEQAAAELRGKIRSMLQETERRPGLSRAGRRRLEGVRDQLPSAHIGTIHAFCARILRLHPAEAGVDAAFTILEGQERAGMIAEAIGHAFVRALGPGESPERREGFRELVRAVPPRRLEKILHGLFRQRETLHGMAPAPGTGRERAVRAAVAAALRSGWIESAAEAARSATGRDAPEVLALVQAAGTDRDPERLADLIRRANERMFTKKGEFRKSFLPADDSGRLDAGVSERLIRFAGGPGRMLSAADGAAADAAYEALHGALLDLYRRAEARYEEAKTEAGTLDFEDLQLRTLRLLDDPALRAGISGSYRHILVDEFQDTNGLQYAIVRGLVDGFARGSLFIVGDPKQSIYGFRNADVGVFYDAAREIEAAPAPPGSGGRTRTVVLAETFRSRPAVAAFVNLVFSELMKRRGSRYEVEYQECIVGRPGEPAGAVELLLTPAPAGGRADAASARGECALIAERIGALAAEGRHRFGACAVLLRDRKHLPALETAFEEAGIPYILAGGVGFFQTQEVYDFLNYLRFLVLPDDDAALAGILRSPFFGFTDAELFLVSREPGSTLLEKLERRSTAGDAGSAAARALSLLAAHRAAADRIPVPRLLRRIASDTGWFGAAAGLSSGPQHRENFLKLLDLARRRRAAGPLTLYDFTAELERRAEEETREGQAATADAGSAVRVMTVHAAKGLEFDVVVLPFLDRPVRPADEPIVEPEFGVGFGTSDGGAEREERLPPLFRCLRQLSLEKAEEEEKRILYVGCTRARQLLVLSALEGAREKRASSAGWLRSVFDAKGIREESGSIDAGEIPVTMGGTGGGRIEPVRLRIPVLRAGGCGPAPEMPVRAAAGGGGRRILIGPVRDAAGREGYTATGLKAYQECPLHYYLSYVLGAGAEPPAGVSLPAADGDDPVEISSGLRRDTAAAAGQIVHEVLSGLLPGEGLDTVASRAQALADSRHPGPASAPVAERAARDLRAFLGSAECLALLEKPDARVEHQISALLGDSVLFGKIDRLFRGDGGGISFLDYKTGEPGGGGIEAMVGEHRPQMAAYAFLISRLTGQSSVVGSLVFLGAGPAVVPLSFGPEDLRRTERELMASIEGIREERFDPPDRPCRRCPRPTPSGCGLRDVAGPSS